MKASQARRLGDLVGRFYTRHDDFTDTQSDEIIRAVAQQSRNYLPDQAISAVVEQKDAVPLVLAATDNRVYALDVESVDKDGPATTRCRLLRLNPASCSVSAVLRYSGSHRFGVRRTLWRFQIHDTGGNLDVTVAGRQDSDGEMDEGALLGKHLAVRLGWEFPSMGDSE